MNTELIQTAARATVTGTKPFPEIVGLLLQAGVEYYLADFVSLRTTYYSANGGITLTPLPFEDLPSVAENFDLAALRANILDSQRNGQNYRDFSRRAMHAGVHGYYAFLRGQRVTYFGRQGDQHTEWFPGAGPAQTEA